jgi:hypothetical protein
MRPTDILHLYLTQSVGITQVASLSFVLTRQQIRCLPRTQYFLPSVISNSHLPFIYNIMLSLSTCRLFPSLPRCSNPFMFIISLRITFGDGNFSGI